MSKDEKEIKVTDRRMFTPEGDLREEYRFLDEKATVPESGEGGASGQAAAPPPRSAPAAAAPAGRPPAHAAESPGALPAGAPASPSPGAPPSPPPGADDRSARLEIPGTPPGLGASFYDLVAMLAEPVAIYLGDIELPDGGVAENLEMARLHIDMLDVLRQKTAGNLTAHESAFLEDLLYRSRLRYVQKRG